MNTNNVNLLSAGSLKGTDVVNKAGDNLGELEELMVDLSNGRVAYAVLSFGGFMGLGDKLFGMVQPNGFSPLQILPAYLSGYAKSRGLIQE